VAMGESGAATGARVPSEPMVVAAAARTSIASGLLAPVYFDFSVGNGHWRECYRPPYH
jgi:hypothetical protein